MVAAAVGVSACVAACGSGAGKAAAVAAAPEKRDIVVAAVPSEGAAGLYIAQQQGLFAKVGLRVKIVKSASSSTVIPAMLAGQVDVAQGQYTTYILESATGGPKMRVIAAGLSLGAHVQEILAPAGTKIQNLGGLKGKRIAVNVVNGITADLLYTALASYGVTPSQVKLVPVLFQDMQEALRSGKVDAIYEVEPYVTEFTYQYGFQALADINTGATRNFPIAGYGVLASWAARYPRTAAAFARAISQANALAATNLPVLQHALQIRLHLSPAVADVMASGIFPTSVDSVQLQRVSDLLLQYGQLKHPFDVRQILGPLDD